jgi:hypothetical protein
MRVLRTKNRARRVVDSKKSKLVGKTNALESSPQDGPQGAKLAEMTCFTGEFLLKALGKFMEADAALRRFSVCAQPH